MRERSHLTRRDDSWRLGPLVGTVGVCVEEFAQGEAVGGFSRREFGVNDH
jgi:hypothetical protein